MIDILNKLADTVETLVYCDRFVLKTIAEEIRAVTTQLSWENAEMSNL